MTEPQGDDRQSYAGLEQVHGGGVPESVEGDFATPQRGARLRGSAESSTQSQGGTLARDRHAVPVGEEILGRANFVGAAPVLNLSLRRRPDRHVAFLAALAVEPDGAVVDLARLEPEHLRNPP